MHDYIADRVKPMDASGIRKIWQLAATMTDPVDFSIGQPDFPPPEPIKNAAINAIKEDKSGYTLTAGLPELRDKLGQAIQREIGWEKPQIMVTCGVSGGLQLSFMTTLNPGDEVIIPDPYFVIYKHMINMLGARCVFVDTYPDFILHPEKIAEKITPKTKMIILNSPANPTGVVYDQQTLQDLAELARKHNLLVLSDEIYRDFSYDHPAESIAKFYENTLILRGFSKAYGMPGWRLGYMALPAHMDTLFDRMATLQQYTFVCAPHPLQAAIIDVLDLDISPQIEKYRHKRDLIYQGLHKAFGLIRPQGAFYAFVPAPGQNAADFVKLAIQNNVLVIPGSAFSQQDTHFRISYATSDSQIQKGIQRLCELAG